MPDGKIVGIGIDNVPRQKGIPDLQVQDADGISGDKLSLLNVKRPIVVSFAYIAIIFSVRMVHFRPYVAWQVMG
jgi:hypothetical protein